MNDNQTSGQTYSGTPFAAETDITIVINCFETVDIDVAPFDAPNRVYPNDDYVFVVQLHNSNVSSGDPIYFFAASGTDED